MTRTPAQVENLLELGSLMRGVTGAGQYDIRCIGNRRPECGTRACTAGWMTSSEHFKKQGVHGKWTEIDKNFSYQDVYIHDEEVFGSEDEPPQAFLDLFGISVREYETMFIDGPVHLPTSIDIAEYAERLAAEGASP